MGDKDPLLPAAAARGPDGTPEKTDYGAAPRFATTHTPVNLRRTSSLWRSVFNSSVAEADRRPFPKFPKFNGTRKERSYSVPNLTNALWQAIEDDLTQPYLVGLAPTAGTAANLAKSIAGAAVFALPYVFARMGLLGGACVIAFFTILSMYTMSLLLHAKHLVAEDTLEQYISYVDIANHAFGANGGRLIYVLSILASLGVGAFKLTFVVNTLGDILTDEGHGGVSPWFLLGGCLLIVTPLTFLRSFKILGYASIFGMVAITACVFGTLGYGWAQQGELSSDAVAIDWAEVPKSMGTIAFVFCVNFLMLPIERSMQHPTSFETALNVSVGGVAAVCTAFSALCYALFADQTCPNVLVNLREAGIGGTILKSSLCLAELASYPLVIAPANETLEQTVMPHVPRNRGTRGIVRRLLRSVVILVTVGCSQLKNFSVITNLLGGFTSLPLTLILPPLLYMKLMLRPSQRGSPTPINEDEDDVSLAEGESETAVPLSPQPHAAVVNFLNEHEDTASQIASEVGSMQESELGGRISSRESDGGRTSYDTSDTGGIDLLDSQNRPRTIGYGDAVKMAAAVNRLRQARDKDFRDWDAVPESESVASGDLADDEPRSINEPLHGGTERSTSRNRSGSYLGDRSGGAGRFSPAVSMRSHNHGHPVVVHVDPGLRDLWLPMVVIALGTVITLATIAYTFMDMINPDDPVPDSCTA